MPILAKYGQALSLEFPMLVAGSQNFAATGDWTPATGDTKISKDAGNVANTTNNPAAVGGTGSVTWSLTLTATEMQAARVTVQIVDSATKAVEDQMIVIHTYGHASALHAADLDDATALGLSRLDAAVTSRAAPGDAMDLVAGAVDAAAVATGAIDADALATDAVTEIQAGLATSAELATVQADTDNIQTRLPAALVSGRMDSHVGALADGVLTAAKAATGFFDAVLTRALSDVEGSAGFRSLAGAVAKLVNRVGLSGGTLTVYKTDDTTAMGTQTATQDASATPVVEVNTD